MFEFMTLIFRNFEHRPIESYSDKDILVARQRDKTEQAIYTLKPCYLLRCCYIFNLTGLPPQKKGPQ